MSFFLNDPPAWKEGNYNADVNVTVKAGKALKRISTWNFVASAEIFNRRRSTEKTPRHRRERLTFGQSILSIDIQNCHRAFVPATCCPTWLIFLSNERHVGERALFEIQSNRNKWSSIMQEIKLQWQYRRRKAPSSAPSWWQWGLPRIPRLGIIYALRFRRGGFVEIALNPYFLFPLFFGKDVLLGVRTNVQSGGYYTEGRVAEVSHVVKWSKL